MDLKLDKRPVRLTPYREGPAMVEHTRTKIDKILAAGVIDPTTSEWASPVVFACRKDGNVRLWMDYWRQNTKAISDTFPALRINDCTDSLGDTAVFATLDCNSVYWQKPVAERDKEEATFITHLGTHRYTGMRFGLKNAPVTFRRVRLIILSKGRWQAFPVYLDDFVVF